MPTKPTLTKDLDQLTSADIINTTRNVLGGSYAEAVPKLIKEGDVLPNGNKATAQDAIMSLRGIGNILYEFQPLANAFLSNIVNRIGRVIITSRLYENPWAMFKKGLLEYGETIEEIFVQLAKPYQYDPNDAENTVFKRRIPDVKAAFHSMNYQKYYPTTVSNDQLRQAFLSWQGITDLIGRIIEQVYTGANYDEFMTTKYLAAKTALNGNIYPVGIAEPTPDNARSITTQMVTYAKNLSYMSDEYNPAGVQTYTDRSSLYMILTTDIQSIFDVEVLALSFNMDKAELIGRQVEVDGFGVIDEKRMELLFADDPYNTYVPFTDEEKKSLKSIKGLMVDVDWFMLFDNYYNMTEIYNPQGLYWNYFYHVWKTFSISPFSNAVLFTTENPAITSVTVSPGTASIEKGASVQFSAEVVGTGFASKSVIWSVNSLTSTIDTTGKLTVSTEETETTLTVTATSKYDSTKTGTATVTITAG